MDDKFQYIEKEREKMNHCFDNILGYCKQKEIALETLKQTYDTVNERLVKVIQSKKGEKIYWASYGWNKYETHTITDARFEKVTSDFFGKHYLGKMCVKIFVDDGNSYYLADHIGETLFFDKDEAYQHTALYLEEQRQKGETK